MKFLIIFLSPTGWFSVKYVEMGSLSISLYIIMSFCLIIMNSIADIILEIHKESCVGSWVRYKICFFL